MWRGTRSAMIAAVTIGSMVAFGASFFLLTDTNWTSDEGAVRLQVATLSEGGWYLERPLAELDPEGRTVPTPGATVRGSSYAPYAKNPALPILLGTMPAGNNGRWLVLPSLLFGLAGAAMIAVVTFRVDRRAGVWAFLIVALASPVFFYSYTVLAHTWLFVIAAIMAVLIALTVQNSLRSRYLFALFACAAIAPYLRREGLILALAVAGGVGVAGWRTERLRASVGAAAIAFGAVGGAVLNNKWWAVNVGGGQAVSEPAPLLDILRLARGGFALLISGNSPFSPFLLAVLVLTMATALTALLVYREPERIGAHVAAAAVVVLASIATMLIGGNIGGFFMAMPLLGAGLFVSASVVREYQYLRVSLIVGALVIVGAVVTTGPSGGGSQWGGRYVIAALPFLVPVAFVALSRVLRSAPDRSRQALVVALASATIATGMLAPISLRNHRQDVASFAATLTGYAELVPKDSETERPIIISSQQHIGRQSWRNIGGYRYLLMDQQWLNEYVERVAESDARSMLFVGYWSVENALIFDAAGYEATPDSSDPYWVMVAPDSE